MKTCVFCNKESSDVYCDQCGLDRSYQIIETLSIVKSIENRTEKLSIAIDRINDKLGIVASDDMETNS